MRGASIIFSGVRVLKPASALMRTVSVVRTNNIRLIKGVSPGYDVLAKAVHLFTSLIT